MADESRVFRGARIRVRASKAGSAERGAGPGELGELRIDDRLIPTTRVATGGHWTHLLPYEEFDSLMSLGEAVVEHAYGRLADGESGSPREAGPGMGGEEGRSWR